jgi:hypothetical protein
MVNTGQPVEPGREVVEGAIVKLLGIAQGQGITPADLLRMLDSGMRISDFLTAWFCQLDLAPFDTLIWPHPNLSY